MNRTAKYLTKKFDEPVIGDSMILYKAVYQLSSGRLVSRRDRHYDDYEYKLGVVAKPRFACAPANHGVCDSGIHVGSMEFAKRWGSDLDLRLGAKVVILACQVRIKDMVIAGYDGKVRCKEVLPLGIVQS